jgi:hypothetical protein
MHLSEEIQQAIETANSLSKRLYGIRLKTDRRSAVAAASFAIAQQHHQSILILISHPSPCFATAFALLRPLIEATMRGLWISKCATDEKIEVLITGSQKMIDMANIFKDLDSEFKSKKSAYEKIYQNSWKTLSAYTHSYHLQLQRWMTTQHVEGVYTDEEVIDLIKHATNMGSLAAAGVESLQINQ